MITVKVELEATGIVGVNNHYENDAFVSAFKNSLPSVAFQYNARIVTFKCNTACFAFPGEHSYHINKFGFTSSAVAGNDGDISFKFELKSNVSVFYSQRYFTLHYHYLSDSDGKA